MSRYTNLVDDLYIDGTALSSLKGVIPSEYNFFGDGAKRGSNDTIPGRYGQVGTYKPLDAYSFSVSVGITGESATGTYPGDQATERTNMLTNLAFLVRTLSANGGLCTLTRRVQNNASYVDTQCNGEFIAGTALELFVPEAGRTELEWINLDGCWKATSSTTIHQGTSTVTSDYPTRDVLLTLPSAGILQNHTAGVILTVTQACTVNALTYAVSAGLSTLTHSGDYAFFVLNPGSNVISWSGTGTVDLEYKGMFV